LKPGRFMTNIIRPSGAEWQDKRETGVPNKQGARFALSDYADEWHFFNHGTFFSHAGFKYPAEDPVADWYVEQPPGTALLLQPFARCLIAGMVPVTGLGKLTWGHIICGVRKELWQRLFEFLGGVCSVNRQTKRYSQTFSGDLDIPDPVLVERHSILKLDIPTIRLTVFCTDGNVDRWELRPPTAIAQPMRMVRMPPRQEVVDVGNAVLSGDFSNLQHSYNPAFQPHLDKYQQLTGKDPIDVISHRLTDKH
jgi:hypothetical protein